jgi:transposase
MRQRTRLANAIRGHMAEYGIVAPIGREGLQRLIEMIVRRCPAGLHRAARAWSGFAPTGQP